MLNLILRTNNSFLMKCCSWSCRDTLPLSWKPLAHIYQITNPWHDSAWLRLSSTVLHFSATSLPASLDSFHPIIGFLCTSLRTTGTCAGRRATVQSWLVADTYSPILEGPSQSLGFFCLLLVDSFSASHCSFLDYTVFPHILADDLGSTFTKKNGATQTIVYKTLAKNSWNCLMWF